MMKRILLSVFFLVFLASPVFAVVPDSTSKSVQNCNGSATSFPFTFGVGATSEVKVTQTTSAGISSVLLETTNYSVSCTNNNCSAGGSVVTVATCPSGSTITLERNVPYTQDADFTEGMATLYETFETGLDKLTRIAQQQRALIGDIQTQLAGTTLSTAPRFYHLVADYGSIADAITDIGGVGATLLCDAPVSLGANTNVTANINFLATKGCLITTTGYTITFNGTLESGLYQIFSGTGTVTGLKESYPEWWGPNTSPGITDMTAEINAATASGAKTVYLSGENYLVSSSILLYQGQELAGAGYKFTTITANQLAKVIRTDDQTAARSGLRVRDLQIDNTTIAANTRGIDFTNVSSSDIERVRIINCANPVYGETDGQSSYYNRLDHVFVADSTNAVMLASGANDWLITKLASSTTTNGIVSYGGGNNFIGCSIEGFTGNAYDFKNGATFNNIYGGRIESTGVAAVGVNIEAGSTQHSIYGPYFSVTSGNYIVDAAPTTNLTNYFGDEEYYPWIAYTPVVTSGGGTITAYTATGRYRIVGSRVYLQVKVVVTTKGSATGGMTITLPVAKSGSAFYNLIPFMEQAVTTPSGTGSIAANGTDMVVYIYDGTTPFLADGNIWAGNGWYELKY